MRMVLRAITLFFVLALSGCAVVQPDRDFGNTFHIALSIITFSALCLAGLQAVVLAVQERLLRGRPRAGFFEKLPALEAMERFLFQLIVVNFILLSVLLSTSVYFFHAMLWQNDWLIQKTVLVFLAWVIFATLLLGRFLRGWRGRKATYGTMWAVLLLMIVYLGSQLMLKGWHG